MSEENNEKEKQGASMDAMVMTKHDVTALMDRMVALAKQTLNDVCKLHLGEGYSAAEDSVLAFADEILFGTIYDFRDKNKWLKKISYEEIKDLVKAKSGQTEEDLMRCMEMWRVTGGNVGSRHLNNVYQYLQEAVSGGFLRQAYRVMREDMIIRNEHYSELISKLDFAFEEYYKTLEKYKRASIFNEIPAKKTNPYELNYKLVTDHMLEDFKQSGNLGDIIHDTLAYIDPYWFNYFTIIDSDTRRLTRLPEISKFADEIAKVATLDNEATSYFKSCGPFFAPLCESIHDVLDYVRFTYREARDILNNYRYNTQEFPYSIMHYSPWVKKAAESFMSLKDPATNGTDYVGIAWGMVHRCEQLAQTVAKQAP